MSILCVTKMELNVKGWSTRAERSRFRSNFINLGVLLVPKRSSFVCADHTRAFIRHEFVKKIFHEADGAV